MKKVSILGSTGSIGLQALDVARKHKLKIQAIAANSSYKVLEEQAREFITMGYLLPVLDYFKDQDIRVKAQETLERRVSNV